MIRVLIIEDEPPAVKRLTQMLSSHPEDIRIVDCIDSVESGVKYVKNFENFDLIISDIQLADGNSFEIFSQVKVRVPIIFATAYDEYMMQAFKVNSVDYLLKPYDQEELSQAIEKFKSYHHQNGYHQIAVEELLNSISKKNYKQRFLVKKGKELAIVPCDQIAYFYSEDGYVHLMCDNGSRFIVEFSLDQLTDMLDPSEFFRISRKFFIHTSSISRIHSYFNSRLKLTLQPKSKTDAIVSRERVSEFKQWLDR